MRNNPWRWPLFLFYLALYAAFVLINALAPDTMDLVVFAGLNLAVVYGFGLIAVAIVLAGIYGMIGGETSSERRAEADDESIARPEARS